MRSANLFFFTQPQEIFEEWYQTQIQKDYYNQNEEFFAEFQQIPVSYGSLIDTAYQDSLFWKEQHLYGSSRLGIAKPELEVTNFKNSNFSLLTSNFKNYELTNHLGNILATIKDEKQQIDQNADGIVDYYELIVITANDYYPFGMVMPNRSFSLGGSNYRFGFQGFEKDNEISGVGNHLAFGDYGYDPRIGRRWNIDPMISEMPYLSSYVFCSNSPISKLDPDGKWDVSVHAYSDRAKSGYALLVVTDNDGVEVYRTVVKTIGTGGSVRNVKNSNTPQGNYKILGWRKTGKGTGYNRVSFGPNDLLALDYQGGEGGKRDGMHVHGGRQEGKYKGRKNLASTHGCMRINDDDIKAIKNVTTNLEKNDPTEKAGNLTLKDDLKSPIQYDENRNSAGLDQFPKTTATPAIPFINIETPPMPVDNTYVAPPVIMPVETQPKKK